MLHLDLGLASAWRGGGAPVPAAALLDLDFAGGAYAVAGTAYGGFTACPGVSFARAAAGYGESAAGALSAFASGAARITDLGLRYEPAKTNIIPHSKALNSWSTSSQVILTGSQAAPDGTTSAYLIADDNGGGSSGNCYVQQNSVVISATTQYTVSFIAKAASSDVVEFVTANDSGGSFNRRFNLTTGVTTNLGGSATSGGMRQLGSTGWWLCWMTWTSGADTNIAARIGFPNISRDGTHSFHVWGAQIETGALATSPIDTAGASATRAADAATIALPAGDPTDAITVTWDGGGPTVFTRADLAVADVLNLSVDGGAPWMGGHVERILMEAA